MPWLAAIWIALRGFLGLAIRYAGPWVVQGLLFFSIKIVSSTYVAAPLLTFIEGKLSAGPAMVANALNAVGVVSFFTIILSAYATATAGRLLFRKAAP
jgi:hypothetical protein